MAKQKLYCYVDETGQDTLGNFFLVSIVLGKQNRNEDLQQELIKLEKTSHKNFLKWTRTPFKVRSEFLLGLIEIKELKNSIYYSVYKDTKEYIPLTALTIAKAILSKEEINYTVTVIIDGLKDKEREQVRTQLKKLKIRYNKIRGMRDEQNTVIRLADSIAGFLRDSLENQPYTKTILKRFKEARIIIEV